MSKIGDSAFNSIKTVTEFNSFSLSALNYLNMRDYGHFYSLANSATAPFETYLLSYFILSKVNFDTTILPSAPYNFPADGFATAQTYLATGDRLCWGAASEGIVHISHYFSFKPISEKAIHSGLLGSVFCSIGFTFCWLSLMTTTAMTRNSRTTSGHVGDFTVYTFWVMKNTLQNFPEPL